VRASQSQSSLERGDGRCAVNWFRRLDGAGWKTVDNDVCPTRGTDDDDRICKTANDDVAVIC
jgi:hypothetical protein